MSKRNARREFTYQVHKAGRAIYEAGELAERERIIALLETYISRMKKAGYVEEGFIGPVKYAVELIKGENK